jgi:pimeloyl-ACP methyl ester carboxylesterase
MHSERVALPGVELQINRWDGERRPFVLVHGLASNARLWDGVAEHLHEAGHAVVAVDQRGHGRSAKPDTGYGTGSIVQDLLALVETLGLRRPVLAGQSWGANVVLEAAAFAPDEVAAVALVDGGWIHLADTFPTWEACRAALSPPALAGTPVTRLEAGLRAAHPTWPEAGIQGTLANFEVLDDGTIRPWLTLDRHLLVLAGLYAHRPRERYAAVTAPVLLAPAGSSDEAAARAWDQRAAVLEAAAGLPDARVQWFPWADHDLHAQHPAELAAALLDLAGAAR